MLAPDRYYDGRRRSRSTGGRPLPNINVVQNTYDYDDPPRSRSRHRYHDDDLVDAVDDVAREIRHNRGRSPSPYMMQQQMQLELARERERSRWELERERERLEYELEHDRIEAKQRAETEMQLARTRSEIRQLKARLEDDEREGRIGGGGGRGGKDWELQRLRDETRRREEERRRKEERDRILAEKDREDRDEKDRQEAAIAAFKKKQDKEKQDRADLLAQLKREEEEKAKKAKEEKEMWRQKLEKEKKEEEEKKKKKEQEIEDELAKRLHKVGFQQNQVDAILDPKKKKILPGSVPHNALIISKPTYIRIHRDHIDIETLRYFNLPWEYDQGDSKYIVILQEIDKHETEILFEHTRKLRKGATTLLIEDRGRHRNGEHQYAFVKRRPSASPSRRKHSPKRVSVNFGLFN